MKYLLGLALSFFLMASLARADGVTVVLSVAVEGWPAPGSSLPRTEFFPSLAALPDAIDFTTYLPLFGGFVGFGSLVSAIRDSQGNIEDYSGPAVANGNLIDPPGFVYDPNLAPEQQWPFDWPDELGSGEGLIVTSEPGSRLLLVAGAAFGLLLLRRLHA